MATQIDNVFSVSSLNRSVKQLLEQNIGIIWLSAEVSNFIRAQSGHWYFTLKDHQAQVKSACFRGNNQRLAFQPKNGDKVLVRARVSLYEPRGDYQIIAEYMEPDGEGLLKLKFEELKHSLAQAGLFASEHKKTLPRYPQKVGVVTSATGAAIHDILTVMRRRAPNIEIIIYPSLVQGQGASRSLVSSLSTALERQEVDVIIVTRGGGSMEDMWCFNDEQLARCIYQADLPIISAVGHEVDFTIADFVADVRAATPSAAAEIISQHQAEVVGMYKHLEKQLVNVIKVHLSKKQQRAQNVSAGLYQQHPRVQLEQQAQKLDLFEQQLTSNMQQQMLKQSHKLQKAQTRLTTQQPQVKIQQYEQGLGLTLEKLSNLMQIGIEQRKQKLNAQAGLLNAINPLNTLSRGYNISYKQDKVVVSTKQLSVNDIITTDYQDGKVTSQITKIE